VAFPLVILSSTSFLFVGAHPRYLNYEGKKIKISLLQAMEAHRVARG
jgi:hypothetical protein